MRTKLTLIQQLVDLQDGFLVDLEEAIRSSSGVNDALGLCIATHKTILEELTNYAKSFAQVGHKAGTPQKDVLDAGQLRRHDPNDRG